MSCTGIRKCFKDQIDLLAELWAQIKPHMDNPSQGSLKQKAQRSPLGYDTHYGGNVLDILQKENMDFMKVTQIVCKSHTILRVNPGVVHRGIANNSDQQRVLFTINCSPKYFELNEQPMVISNFTQEKNKKSQMIN